MNMIQFILLWYIGINVFSFLAYSVDKKKAKNNEWRISEKFLLLLSVFGGGIGSFFGMRIFHHKTQKVIFRIWVPLWIVLHIALLLWGNERINFTKQDDGTAVSVIGGADGPTSIFIAGKLGGEEEKEVTFLINREEIPVIWENNDTVRELFSQAKENPIEIQMSMYGGNEQVGSLGGSYTRNDIQMTTENGDIVLYSGNQLVVFYAPNTWNYTKLGKMDLPEDAVTALLSNGDVVITIK